LRSISLSVEENKIVGLIGRNGSGRTVTLKSIMGLIPVSSGTITYGSESITNYPPHQVARRGIAFVPEERIIFPDLSVEENLKIALIALGRKPRDELFNLIYKQFPILSPLRNRLGNTLSGGQQQILAIARGLITEPRLMLLDEPTKGLAPAVIAEVKESLALLKKKGLSMLIVDQNVEVLRDIADYFYVINRGEIQFQGDYAALDREKEEISKSLGYIYKV
jgi:ABC-type branched-subunit amino acid transport system ATPase component